MIKNKKHTSKILIIFLTLAGMLLGEADFSFRNISVKDGLAESKTKVNHEAWIESVKNPPAPAEVDKALPW